MEGGHLAGQVLIPGPLQEGAEEVRQTIQPLEEAGASRMEDARIDL